MNPTITRDGAIFKHGDIVTVTYVNAYDDFGDPEDEMYFKDCKLVYLRAGIEHDYKHWYILSNHRVLDGSCPHNENGCEGYKYSWSLGDKGFSSDAIERIELQNVHKGKWANGSFRKKLIDKNLI